MEIQYSPAVTDWGLCRRILAGVWLLLAFLPVLWVLRGLLVPPPHVRVQIEEPFNYGFVSTAAHLSVRGFHATSKGFALGPHSEGEIEYRVHTGEPLTRWSAITLQWYGGEAGIRSTVDLLGPEGPQRLLEDRSLVGTRLPLPASLANPTEIRLRFIAQNATGEERLILDKLVIQAWEGPPAPLPNVYWVGGIFLALCLGVAGLRARPKQTVLVGLLLTVALVLRYVNLLRVAMAPLDPDAQSYRAYAQALTWIGPHGFYSASFGEREPLYPALVRVALTLLGDSDLSLRLLTLALSIGVVYLTFRLGRALFGFGGGLGAGMLLGLSVPAVIESGRGLRVELEALLLTGSAWLLLGKRGSLTFGRAGLAGLLAGALLLTRFPYAPALIVLFAASAWWHRDLGPRVWRPILVATTIALVLVLPHRVALALRHGDEGYDVHRTLRWIANQEFQGQPGFPSPEGVVRDPYAGPRITLAQYYFGLHSPWEVAWRSARGLARAGLNLSPVGYVEEVRAVLGLRLGWVDILVTALGVIGLPILMSRRNAGWIVLVLLLGLVHVAFVYDLDLPDYRFRMILQVMPLFAVAVAAGSRWILARMVVVLPGARWSAARDGSLSTLASTGKSP
jgi:4-amino-4-deoxy-L-arabinose transferase-like glycosyltransferase